MHLLYRSSSLLSAWTIACLMLLPTTVKAGSIDVSQLAEIDGSVKYNLFINPGNSVRFTAPDGTIFRVTSPDLDVPVTRAEFEQRFIGTWSERLFNGQESQFTVAPFIDSVFHAVPTVVSPVSGATVPEQFVITWNYPNGLNPHVGPNPLPLGIRSADSFGSNFVSTSPPALRVGRTLRNGESSVQLTMRVGTADAINQFLTGGHTGLFHTLSAPLIVTVVPEPSTFAVAAFGILVLIVFRKRFSTPGYATTF